MARAMNFALTMVSIRDRITAPLAETAAQMRRQSFRIAARLKKLGRGTKIGARGSWTCSQENGGLQDENGSETVVACAYRRGAARSDRQYGLGGDRLQ